MRARAAVGGAKLDAQQLDLAGILGVLGFPFYTLKLEERENLGHLTVSRNLELAEWAVWRKCFKHGLIARRRRTLSPTHDMLKHRPIFQTTTGGWRLHPPVVWTIELFR
jgi:hypothetical protein